MDGYLNNYINLLLLINQYSPNIITLQETHLHSSSNIPIPINYNNSSITWYGRVGLLIHNSIEHKPITLQKDFATLCLEVKSGIKFNIISAYINPLMKLQTANISNMFGKLSTPSIISGDFNAWHRSFGSTSNNMRRRIRDNYMTNSPFILLNDGSATHLSSHGSFSYIDLTFCSPSLTMGISWETDNNLFGSDHFPIIITIHLQQWQHLPPSLKPTFKTQ